MSDLVEPAMKNILNFFISQNNLINVYAMEDDISDYCTFETENPYGWRSHTQVDEDFANYFLKAKNKFSRVL